MVKAVSGLVGLAAAFGAGAVVALAAQQAVKALSNKSDHVPAHSSIAADDAKGSDARELELLTEQLSRIRTFFGDDGLAAIQDAFVVVVGLGGVGSHAAHMLARSGVGKLRLIDFDNVTLSSLNRHAVATRADVGTPKVAAMKRHLKQIVPDCEIEDIPVMFEADCADELLAGGFMCF